MPDMFKDNVIEIIEGAVYLRPWQPPEHFQQLLSGTHGPELAFEAWVRISHAEKEKEIKARITNAWKAGKRCYLKMSPYALPYQPEAIKYMIVNNNLAEQIHVPILSVQRTTIEDELGFKRRILKMAINTAILFNEPPE